MKIHKRSSDLSQQTSRATRPPLPRDASKDGINKWESGFVPPGGFTSVWDFGNGKQTKLSPTTVCGRRVTKGK